MKKAYAIETVRPADIEEPRAILFGLGPIGVLAGKLVAAQGIKVVGAVDIDPEKVGKDVGELLELESSIGVEISDDAASVFANAGGNVVVHTTTSYIEMLEDQLSQILGAGLNVVSSSEELFYPFLRGDAIAQRIDALAKEKGATALGTGVNPGFVMDVFPLVLSGVCRKVERVRAERVVDAATRRMPLQRKVGVGLTVEEFEAKVQEGAFGHVGLAESIAFLAAGLGWPLDEIDETIEPVVAEAEIVTDYFKAKSGRVAGLHQLGVGKFNGQTRIELDLHMFAGAKHPRDRVVITGDPGLDVRIEGGTPGDVATPAALINAIPRVIAAPPGLATMATLPLPSAYTDQAIRLVMD